MSDASNESVSVPASERASERTSEISPVGNLLIWLDYNEKVERLHRYFCVVIKTWRRDAVAAAAERAAPRITPVGDDVF